MNTKKLGFGLMRLPLLDQDDAGSINFEILEQMVDAYLERGFTYFDTAWMYCGGKSESAVKRVLVDRYPRESFTVTSKLPAYMLKTEADRDKVFYEQLNRTGVGYFDYYLLHDVNIKTVQTFRELDCFSWIKEKKAQGIVKKIGFSYHDGPELLDEILTAHPEFDVVQLQLNYLDWDSPSIQSKACYEVAVKHGKPVIVMEPVRGGVLADVPEEAVKIFKEHTPEMSVASWAIRFAASLENVMVVLSGMSNMEQLLDNTGYMQEFVPLTDEEMQMIYKAVDIINSTITIPCTGCAYCIVDCPKNIAIPKYFALYNTDVQLNKDNDDSIQKSYYNYLSARFGKSSDCIKCGKCEKMCPQHLEIRKLLVDVKERFEK